MEDIQISVFDRVVYEGRDVDYTADIAAGTVVVKAGLSPEQYVKIGGQLQRAVADYRRTVPLMPLVSTETR